MENPFRKRATEYLLRDEDAFLAIVTPEPVSYFLADPGKAGRLYDRLVLLRGTPGSGKTTLARLFEYPTFHTLLQNSNFDGHKDITAALASCNASSPDGPRILGFRLPLETGYRDFWEFDYKPDLKTNLMTALLQSRAVLGWLRHLKHTGIDPDTVTFVTRPEAEEVAETIGGTNGELVRQKAIQVERAVYDVMNSLLAPAEADLPPEATAPYRPFDIIERISMPNPSYGSGNSIELIPLAIFDDAHVLHPDQYRSLERFLLRRELRVARWMIARFDILMPDAALAAVSNEAADPASFPGVSADRESEVILLQSSGVRRTNRTRFRNMAKDMARRYLRRMPVLNERGYTVLGNLLADADVSIKASSLTTLRNSISTRKTELKIRDETVLEFQQQARDYKKANSEELVLAMVRVMMHRYAVRRSQRGPTLFEMHDDDGDSDVRVGANDSVYLAAVLQLFHEFGRPYYYGIDDLCDASSENAEQFLQLAAEMVEAVVTQVSRNRPALLTPERQSTLLRKRGKKIMDGWRFPHDDKVRKLIEWIAKRCLAKSLEPNGAVLANAVGIPQEELDSMASDHQGLATVLQFAIAYNAISLVPHHSCKKRTWCLLELGGMALLHYGLTLKRGGFVESSAEELAEFLEDSNS